MPPEDRHSGVPGGGGGANVKSGRIPQVTDNTSASVTFGTAFASAPHVVATIGQQASEVDLVSVFNQTTTGFSVRIHKGHGGAGHSWDVDWIATDAGDP